MEVSELVCNGHIGELDETERQARIQKIALHLDAILRIANIEINHNTDNTPLRWAKMFMNDILEGRFMPEPEITDFVNDREYDQMIVQGPIEFTSTCAHHLLPFWGVAYIGLLPSIENGKIIGLSKYVRIVDFFSRRMQLQEDLTAQIADFIEEKLEPHGVGVQIIASHSCMKCRGVRRDARTLTTVLRGVLKEDGTAREEFLSSCRALGE